MTAVVKAGQRQGRVNPGTCGGVWRSMIEVLSALAVVKSIIEQQTHPSGYPADARFLQSPLLRSSALIIRAFFCKLSFLKVYNR